MSADAQLEHSIVYTYRIESIDGFSVSALKSAIQKYARRKVIEKGALALSRLIAFGHSTLDENGVVDTVKNKKNKVGPREVTCAKGVLTNTINRMVCMMAEEVNIHEPLMPLQLMRLYTEYYKTASPRRARLLLMSMFRLLAVAPKRRILSDMKTVYMLPPYYEKDAAKRNDLQRTMYREFGMVWPEEEMKNSALKDVVKYLVEKSNKAFYALSFLLAKSSETDCATAMKSLMEKVVTIAPKALKPVVEALAFFFHKMKHQEKPLYLYQAMLMFILDIDPQQAVAYSAVGGGASASAASERRRLWLKHQEGGCVKNASADDMERYFFIPSSELKLDDYVIDIHVKSMKSKKDEVDFAEEGALIVDEDMRYKDCFNTQQREMYIRMKYLLVGAKSKGSKKRRDFQEEEEYLASKRAKTSATEEEGGCDGEFAKDEEEQGAQQTAAATASEKEEGGKTPAATRGGKTSKSKSIEVVVDKEMDVEMDGEEKKEAEGEEEEEAEKAPTKKKATKTKDVSKKFAFSDEASLRSYCALNKIEVENMKREAVEGIPRAQLITSKHKKSVYMDGRVVYKGIYKVRVQQKSFKISESTIEIFHFFVLFICQN